MTSDTAANVAQVATAAVAVLALIGAVYQVRITRAIARQTRTYEYLDHFTERGETREIAKARDFLVLDGADPEEKWDEFFKKSREDRNMVVLHLNRVEDFAAMYNSGLVDREIAHRILAAPFGAYWDEAEWLISRIRKRPNGDQYFREWIEMREDFGRR